MKKYQFEEITCGISIIIALMSYSMEIYFICAVFVVKAAFDLHSCWKASEKRDKKKLKKKVK